MIVSFKDKRTREFAEGNRVKAFAKVKLKTFLEVGAYVGGSYVLPWPHLCPI